MKYFIKRYWLLLLIAFVINVPLIVIGTVRTNYSLTLKGDTTPITSFMEIEDSYNEEGSFSSIYVISYQHSTVLQNLFADANFFTDKNEISESVSHLTSEENYLAGQIQKQSSIDNALILSFTRAKQKRSDIVFDYKFDCACISYYSKTSNLRIGDRVIAVDGVTNADEEAFIKAYNSSTKDSTFTIIRNNETIDIARGEGGASAYKLYEIDYEAVVPKITIKSTNTGGPSAGFLQALSLYNRLIPEDITHGKKIAGTGTISVNGTVGGIGGIKQKVATALDDNAEVFFCPKVNREDGLEAYNRLPNHERMKFIVVETLDDAIRELENL